MKKIASDDYLRLTPEEKCFFNGKLLARRWKALARPEQIPFKKDSIKVSVMLAGRGAGKTRSATEWVLEECLTRPGTHAGILGPTLKNSVETAIFSSESGVYTLLPDKSLAQWNENKRILKFVNGSTVRCFTSEKRSDMRGPEFHIFWVDEIADLAHDLECWKILYPAVRLKSDRPARIYCTGTPRTTKLLLHIIDRADHDSKAYQFVTASTKDNLANLDESTVEELYAQWEGTPWFLQEVEGVFLREAEHALWTQDTISKCRRQFEKIEFEVVGIGVDPAVSSDKDADECGIIVGGLKNDQVYILADYTRRASALEWSRLLVQLARKHSASVIVYERNLAGPLIRDVMKKTLHEMDERIKLVPVQAKGKKHARAEPIAALYEAGRVLHLPNRADIHCRLDKLEDQMVTWEPTAMKSPDRIDALVHLVDHLLIRQKRANIIRAGSTTWNKR